MSEIRCYDPTTLEVINNPKIIKPISDETVIEKFSLMNIQNEVIAIESSDYYSYLHWSMNFVNNIYGMMLTPESLPMHLRRDDKWGYSVTTMDGKYKFVLNPEASLDLTTSPALWYDEQAWQFVVHVGEHSIEAAGITAEDQADMKGFDPGAKDQSLIAYLMTVVNNFHDDITYSRTGRCMRYSSGFNLPRMETGLAAQTLLVAASINRFLPNRAHCAEQPINWSASIVLEHISRKDYEMLFRYQIQLNTIGMEQAFCSLMNPCQAVRDQLRLMVADSITVGTNRYDNVGLYFKLWCNFFAKARLEEANLQARYPDNINNQNSRLTYVNVAVPGVTTADLSRFATENYFAFFVNRHRHDCLLPALEILGYRGMYVRSAEGQTTAPWEGLILPPIACVFFGDQELQHEARPFTATSLKDFISMLASSRREQESAFRAFGWAAELILGDAVRHTRVNEDVRREPYVAVESPRTDVLRDLNIASNEVLLTSQIIPNVQIEEEIPGPQIMEIELDAIDEVIDEEDEERSSGDRNSPISKRDATKRAAAEKAKQKIIREKKKKPTTRGDSRIRDSVTPGPSSHSRPTGRDSTTPPAAPAVMFKSVTNPYSTSFAGDCYVTPKEWQHDEGGWSYYIVNAYHEIRFTGPPEPKGDNWILDINKINPVGQQEVPAFTNLCSMSVARALRVGYCLHSLVDAATMTFMSAYSITGCLMDDYMNRNVLDNLREEINDFSQCSSTATLEIAPIFMFVGKHLAAMTAHNYQIGGYRREWNEGRGYYDQQGPIDYHGLYFWMSGRYTLSMREVLAVDRLLLVRPREWGLTAPEPKVNFAKCWERYGANNNRRFLYNFWPLKDFACEERYNERDIYFMSISYQMLAINILLQAYARGSMHNIDLMRASLSAYADCNERIRTMEGLNFAPTPMTYGDLSIIRPGTMISYHWNQMSYIWWGVRGNERVYPNFEEALSKAPDAGWRAGVYRRINAPGQSSMLSGRQSSSTHKRRWRDVGLIPEYPFLKPVEMIDVMDPKSKAGGGTTTNTNMSTDVTNEGEGTQVVVTNSQVTVAAAVPDLDMTSNAPIREPSKPEKKKKEDTEKSPLNKKKKHNEKKKKKEDKKDKKEKENKKGKDDDKTTPVNKDVDEENKSEEENSSDSD